MKRVALGLCYDGSPWNGWQSQPNGKTVQDRLEKAISQFLATPARVICAGRTDTGVHALNQVVHLDTSIERTAESWVRGVNALLPSSISVQWAREVDDDFHARFSARRRTYFYVLRNARVRSPLLEGKVGWEFRTLSLQPMLDASTYLVGTHDFSSFRSSECQAASPIRELHRIHIVQQGEFFLFRFEANAFLHHMVRNLMGALVYVGQGKIQPHAMKQLLKASDRKLAPPTFSPQGLYLVDVEYEDAQAIPRYDSMMLLQQHLGPWAFTM